VIIIKTASSNSIGKLLGSLHCNPPQKSRPLIIVNPSQFPSLAHKKKLFIQLSHASRNLFEKIWTFKFPSNPSGGNVRRIPSLRWGPLGPEFFTQNQTYFFNYSSLKINEHTCQTIGSFSLNKRSGNTVLTQITHNSGNTVHSRILPAETT
jgi:hypothetical protein